MNIKAGGIIGLRPGGNGEKMNGSNSTIQFADPEDIKKNKVMAILAYLLFFLPLLVCPDSKFARFHANQGFIILIALFAVSLVTRLLGIIPILGLVFSLIGILASIAGLVFIIIGMVNAANGEMKPLPFIGHITIIR